MNTTLLLVAVGAGAVYWFYTNNKQNKRQKVMLAKHDVPKIRQRVNDVLNEAQSRHNVAKLLQHNPIGAIKDRYIKAV